jgi:hypothetical protein
MIPALFSRKLSLPQTSGMKSSEFVFRKWSASSGPPSVSVWEAKREPVQRSPVIQENPDFQLTAGDLVDLHEGGI